MEELNSYIYMYLYTRSETDQVISLSIYIYKYISINIYLYAGDLLAPGFSPDCSVGEGGRAAGHSPSGSGVGRRERGEKKK